MKFKKWERHFTAQADRIKMDKLLLAHFGNLTRSCSKKTDTISYTNGTMALQRHCLLVPFRTSDTIRAQIQITSIEAEISKITFQMLCEIATNVLI